MKRQAMTLTAQRVLLVHFAVLGLATSLDAAQVALRERCEAVGSLLTLGEVAEISGNDEPQGAPSSWLARLPLTPAPAPGTRTYLRAGQIRDLMAARGVDVGKLQFTGAPIVAVTRSASSPAAVPHPREANSAVDSVDTAAEIAAAIEKHVRAKTGYDRWKVQVESGPKLLQRVAGMGSITSVNGDEPWTGRRQYQLTMSASDQAVTVTARVERFAPVVVAKRSIARGDLIRRLDVELEWVSRSVPPQTARALEEVVGQQARQTVSEGSTLMQYQVQAPIVVRRGDLVEIYVQTGGVVARTKAVAKQDGGMDDLVKVETLDTKKPIVARVAGYRLLEVFAGAASARDYAEPGLKRTALR